MSRPPNQQKWESSMNIIRGSLDEITRPASNSSRTGSRAGSRVSQSGSANYRRRVAETSGSFEVLPPEVSVQQEYDIEVEEYASSESEYSGESFEESVESNDRRVENPWDSNQREKSSSNGKALNRSWEKQSDSRARTQHSSGNNGQLALAAGGSTKDELHMDSDEENDIVKQIRAEITNQVKQEMKGELDLYRKKFEMGTEAKLEDDLADLEPKVKEAMLKMRKYDRILRKRVVREKEVKRDRIMLQKRLREELDQLNSERKDDGKKELKEVKNNTERFLALAPPPKHDEEENEELPEGEEPGVDVEDYPLSPVFATQVMDDGTKSKLSPRGTEGSTSRFSSDDVELDGIGDHKGKKRNNKDGSSKKNKNKDFVKRNIELAADAGNIIAMTDDEKERVESLLTDLDSLPDIPEEGATNVSFEENPFAVVVHPGEGFLPEEVEMKALQDIDAKLKALLPASDFESITSTPTFNAHREEYKSLFSRTGLQNTDDYIEKLGEQALKDTREERDYKQRLSDIEGELSRLTDVVEQEMESPVLSEYQLQELIDQCLRTMSRATEETESLASTPRSPRTAREELLQNPPKLSEDVLQSLLMEARGSMASSQATTYRSESEAETINTYRNRDDGTMLESISEDKLRELLQNSRATSRTNSSAAGNLADSSDSYSLAPSSDSKQNNTSTKYDGQQVMNNLTNNAQRPSKSSRATAQILRNSFCETEEETAESANDSDFDDGRIMTPHPPNSGRKSTSAGKSRTFSPLPPRGDSPF